MLEDSLSPVKRAWIEARVINELNILPLLARYYGQEQGADITDLSAQIVALQQTRQQPPELHEVASRLSGRFPIRFTVDLQRPLKIDEISRTTDSFNQMCLGCHVAPAGDNSVVIGDLGSFSRSMGDQEWLARLLGGVRGDSYTVLENPFSDSDIARFFRYTRDQLR
ncbi:hypothetical protein [Sedimenticola hydrogenitrophicus]|uniref:hypothetical protein n=1 Tax=Sedimenticola hydrogenitrophicus TaxID=2967975 RepID=UPI0023AFE372|nr:hypothetical protein [Sedimenticola hydrogenitrophicus]